MSSLPNQSSRMEAVQSPVIPLVGELVRQHPGTISLGQGVVAYPPPEKAIAYLSKFLAQPENHKYQSVTGIPELLTAIETKLNRDNQIPIGDRNCIVVTAGSNMAFMNALLAITQADDEIILNLPYYFNHEMAIAMASCRAVLVPTDANYQLNLEAIAQAIAPRTKAIVTISPNNPTGVVYPAAALKAVNDLCRDRGIYHISDEAYDYFTYDGIKHTSPASFPHSEDHTISLFSLSKAYGFASWRIGYMIIPQHLLMAVKKVQDTNLICPPVVAQYAALGALETGWSYCQPYIQELAQVRAIVASKLQSISDICTISAAEGAFYFFLQVKTNMDDLSLVTRLIQEHQVAVIPGSTFGMSEGCYLRVAYGALERATATAGITRLVQGLTDMV